MAKPASLLAGVGGQWDGPDVHVRGRVPDVFNSIRLPTLATSHCRGLPGGGCGRSHQMRPGRADQTLGDGTSACWCMWIPYRDRVAPAEGADGEMAEGSVHLLAVPVSGDAIRGAWQPGERGLADLPSQTPVGYNLPGSIPRCPLLLGGTGLTGARVKGIVRRSAPRHDAFARRPGAVHRPTITARIGACRCTAEVPDAKTAQA